ncbi:phospholipase D family protein [Diaphorobacter ruginosibacter]|uniref:phospholipase D family protein n=1 Tax=Diaphorobacter ruginosibacter TaxID=1715720 RepID=UPI003342CB44
MACLFTLCGCGLPPLEGRSVSQALPTQEAEQTSLGRGIAQELAEHPGLSGVHPLHDPHDAFAARVGLARVAERTLDVQYYIWRNDITGSLLFGELLGAAQRGVRVRLLIDDVGTAGLDRELAALGQHPLIEVRLFNPFMLRKPKVLGYLADLRRANRRMHNKSFTADNRTTIIGGRNIGDEYFGATEGVLFADLDVMAVGPVVADVSSDFDRYWASASAYPARDILPEAKPADLRALAGSTEALLASPRATEYAESIRQSPFVRQLMDHTLPMRWARITMVSDDPAKGLGLAQPSDLILPQLERALGPIHSSIDLVSPYFVPRAVGVQAFGKFVEDGVKVRVLTNSFEATDVPAVHAGYGKRRKALLERGVELYEMRSLVPPYAEIADKKFFQQFGSSGASLHAKTFAVDGERLFVGSFNFDPRSAHLNTEMGFLIDSPEMARQLMQIFDNELPRISYRVELGANGQLRWIGGASADAPVYELEPHTTWYSRALVTFLGWLPIEWLL